MSDPSATKPEHFQGKDAIQHVIEAKTQGIVDKAEPHGTEAPGHIAAGTDAARELSVLMMLTWMLLSYIGLPHDQLLTGLTVFGIALVFWKAGRSAWLAWFRLERLHRVVAEERWEIEHHRDQERVELKALYAAKGLEDPLLDEVISVLMADGDRLLRVMLEEELGLSLECQEHPLKQSIGASLGALCALALCLLGFIIYPSGGLIAGALIAMGAAAAWSADYEKNRKIPAIVWNIGLGILTYGVGYFLLDIVSQGGA